MAEPEKVQDGKRDIVEQAKSEELLEEHVPGLVERGGSHRPAPYATCC